MSRIDPVLKTERWERSGVQRRFAARLSDLPDGVLVELPEEPGTARLRWRGRLHTWTPAGYEDPRPVQPEAVVQVLTPACAVKVLAAGYTAEVHPTAG